MNHRNSNALILLLMLAGCANTDQQELSWTPPLEGKTKPCFCSEVTSSAFFGFDRSELSIEARSTLDKQAKWLMQHPHININIEGHADERGTREYNLALGERRANAVKEYLAAAGVPKASLHVISYGKERPQVLGANEAAWAQNRRSVTIIIE